MKNSHEVHKIKKWMDFRLYGLSTLRTDSGYTLLFAMIVASIVLALGVSLLTISRKEFILSSSATQSSDAFYSADSGLSCAEYWDSNTSYFASTSYSYPSSQEFGSNAISCSVDKNSNAVTDQIMICPNSSSYSSSCPSPADTYPNEIGSTYTFMFFAPFSTDGASNQSCAAVTVDKYYAQDPNLGNAVHLFTTVISAGYNIGYNATNPVAGTPDCSSASPKKVNRTVELTY